MQVHVNNEGSVTVIKPQGAIVLGELDQLEQVLQELARKWVKRVVLNMVEASHIDSAGLELIKRYHRKLSHHGLRLKLCGLNDLTRKIMDITQLSRQFEIYSDTSAAVRSFL